MQLRKYVDTDIESLFELMQREGEEWTYCKGGNREKYMNAMRNSIAYVIIQDGNICGYIRCRDDDGFGIYILDLLVDKGYRGKGYGRRLMKEICDKYPDDTVYVTSDADPYYEKQGCQREGTIFSVEL